MKWMKNIIWLLTKAPTNYETSKDSDKCDYCGADSPWTRFNVGGERLMVICHKCQKKAFDKILKG